MTKRIAMWSGPRNISTAMMRAWENRADCQVWDEPLYGHYLSETGIDHPGAEEIIADQGIDWKTITEKCAHQTFDNTRIFYQKHMTLHLLDNIDRQWLASLHNCFLIRDPESVIASYAAVREQPTLADIGFVQQAELFDYIRELTGETPIVIDSREFLSQPEAMLKSLCNRLDINFDPKMLSWPSGPRDSDGAWAPYWYDSVWKSTGFSPARNSVPELSERQRTIANEAQPYYLQLYDQRMTID